MKTKEYRLPRDLELDGVKMWQNNKHVHLSYITNYWLKWNNEYVSHQMVWNHAIYMSLYGNIFLNF